MALLLVSTPLPEIECAIAAKPDACAQLIRAAAHLNSSPAAHATSGSDIIANHRCRYGLSDARWSDFGPPAAPAALAPAVWLINANDAGLGLLVAAAFCLHRRQRAAGARAAPPGVDWTGVLVLAVLFRDATLWRETVEYMWDHHRLGYPHTAGFSEGSSGTDHDGDRGLGARGLGAPLRDGSLRPHLAACLWLVNGVWLVAPLTTCAWAYRRFAGGLATNRKLAAE